MNSNSDNAEPKAVQIERFTQKIVEIASTKLNGITDKEISSKIPDLQAGDKVVIINNLLIKGVIELFQQGKNLFYKLKDRSEVDTPKVDDIQEKIVYNIIKQAGNKGIWMRQIKKNSQLDITQLNKILKSFESKKYIKVVKSVHDGKKKLYMLFNLEPDESVTGGVWYQGQDFEEEFVDILNQQCYRFLEHRREEARAKFSQTTTGLIQPLAEKEASFASSKDVFKFITDLKVSKVQLTVGKIEVILDTLISDGKIEKKVISGDKLYRVINPLVDPVGLMKNPCGVCPVIKNCSDIGDVTPIKCQYLTEWMDT